MLEVQEGSLLLPGLPQQGLGGAPGEMQGVHQARHQGPLPEQEVGGGGLEELHLGVRKKSLQLRPPI